MQYGSEMDYFASFRNFLKPDLKKKLDYGNAIETEKDVLGEALTVITTEAEINVHLRFLAAHVIWQSISNENSNCHSNSNPKFSVLSPATRSIMDKLQNWTISSTDFSIYSLPLSPADLSILNGFINAATDFSPPFFHFILPLIMRSLIDRRDDAILDPYQHLFVLKNGLEKMTRQSPNAITFEIPDWKILLAQIETKIVRPYWDSRFAGCAELAVDCYRGILHRLRKESIDIGALISRYGDNNRYPWHIRGKYKLLAVLVEFCDLDQLLQCEGQLLEKLGNGLAATHVAPFSSAVYKTVLHSFAQKLRHDPEKVTEPLKRWTLTVIDFLLSENRLLAMHASKYWVPAVAKFVPDGCRWVLDALLERYNQCKTETSGTPILESFIVDSLCDLDLKNLGEETSAVVERQNENELACIIWASMLIRRHARRWLRELPAMEDKDLSIGLRHLDDDVRLETFSLLLDVSGKYIPLSQQQYETATEFLSDNFIVSSSSFRRRLLAAYGKWFRASVDYFAKQNHRQDETVKQFHHFVLDGLIGPIMDNLFPGANYQRMTTTLGILQLTLDCLKLHDSLWSSMQIDQTVTGNRIFGFRLLRCLQNSSEEIRRKSSTLLKSYFKYPFDQSSIDLEAITQLFFTSFTLSRSPKAIDCDTGCVIWDVIAEKFILENHCSIRIDDQGSVQISSVIDVTFSPIHHFLADFLKIMQADFVRLQKDLRTSAEEYPLHGFAQAMAAILEIIRTKTNPPHQIAESIRSEMLDLACRVIDFTLTALGSPAEGLCPSLAEMQDAIGSAGNGDEEEDASIPLDEQLVLACCWLNIKAFASVLTELAAHSLSTDDNPFQTVNRIGHALFDAMSRTRHFGALEGCNLALSKYLRLCMASNLSEVNEIPMNLLEKVLEHVAEPKNVSVTRRAVGFSIMIECIAVAGCAMKKRHFLEVSMSRLLSISEEGLHLKLNDQDEKSDVNVVRAMHCLRLLLRSSSLDLDVLPFVSDCYRLAVEQFSNALWSIRNSAMLILSSILWRLFGRREVKQDEENSTHSENRMDLVEFCADFPQIWKFFCTSLTRILTEGRVEVDSRIFALLSFGQHLIVTDVNGSEELGQEVNLVITQLIQLLFRTPDSRLKRVIAEILANFVPKIGDKRRIFFEKIRAYAMEKGEKLAMNDQMGLVHLMNALKLKPGHVNVEEPQAEMKVPKTDDPVEICRFLKRNLQLGSSNNQINHSLLTDCVDGKSGLSAQCLALPIMAKYYSQDSIGNEMRHELNERFLALSQRILNFTGERQNETRRLAGVSCFFFIGSSMTTINQDSCGSEIAIAKARLILALRALLSDEDELIRYVAASALTTGLRFGQSLSPVLCLKQLSTYLVDHLPSETSLLAMEDIFGDIEDGRDAEWLRGIVEKSDWVSKEKRFLFAQQDFNIYKEDIYHLRVCFESLFIGVGRKLEKQKRGNWLKAPPIELANLCVQAMEKMKSHVDLGRRNGESVFVIASRLLLRRGLFDLTLDHPSQNEVWSLLRLAMFQLFGMDDRMCICGLTFAQP